jgi:antitoxin Phd
MKTWTMTEARAKFYELLRLAEHEGPQEVTRRGKDAVLVMSYEDWIKATSLAP